MKFEIFTEKEIRGSELLNNVKFLRQYQSLPENAALESQLARTLVSLGTNCPKALIEAAFLTQETKMTGLPYLWKMIFRQRIEADLDQKLTMRSPIWMVNGEGF